MSAAMPSIVADLGGLHLYSWVYSAYLLPRAVSLPVFGKLADLYKTRTLFILSILIFLISSIAAGFSPNMTFLVVARVFQGIGAGGNFALVYIVLADIASPENRGKTLALGSFVWGISSVLGPTMGGVIVTYFSWRWIFFINVPLGLFSLLGIGLYLVEFREKRKDVSIDYAGIVTLTLTILALLIAFLLGGRDYAWSSPQIMALFVLTAIAGMAFYHIEKRAKDPILSMQFFQKRGFSAGNASAFFSSFAIFSLFAYAPIFIQGALGKSPLMVGMAMLALSLGWSVSSIALGPVIHRVGEKRSAVAGALFMIAGCALTLGFNTNTSMQASFIAFFLVGVGMGFVTLATLMIVQNSLDIADLGVATTSHQFARTLGGTIGIGICGSFLTAKLSVGLDSILQSGLKNQLPATVVDKIQDNAENLFQPEVQALLPPKIVSILQESVVNGTSMVFGTVLLAAVACLILCLLLSKDQK